MRGFATALGASALLLLMAPFWGRAQVLLQSSVPHALLIALGALFGVAVLATLVAALVRIRRRRGPRYLLLASALVCASLPAFFVEREGLLTEAIERVHLVLFSVLALLFYRAFLRAPTPVGWYAPALTWTSAAIVGTLDESVQGLVAVRTGELYDIGLNAYSSAVGTLLCVALVGFPESRPRWPESGRRHLARLLALAVLLLALFFRCNHLGYLIEDPELGTFRSYVRPGHFAERNAERRSRWSAELPGPPFGPLELEDRFLTEGGWRLTHRNHRHDLGDWGSAWHENLILERYFPAVLDLPAVEAGRRLGDGPAPAPTSRWSAEQRDNVERLLAAAPPAVPYVSPVQPGRIFVRPREGVLWAGSVVAVTILLGLGRRRGTAAS